MEETRGETQDRAGVPTIELLLRGAPARTDRQHELRVTRSRASRFRCASRFRGRVAERTLVQPGYIIKLIQTQSRIYKLEGGNKLKFTIATNTTAERLELVKAMLTDMLANGAQGLTR